MKFLLYTSYGFILVRPVFLKGLPSATLKMSIWQIHYTMRGDYLNSGKAYSKAFEANGWKGMSNDRYMQHVPGLWLVKWQCLFQWE